MITCKQCGNDTPARSGNRPKFFCSKRCSDRFYRSLKPKSPIVDKTCEHCGVVFASNIRRQRWCSESCRYIGLNGHERRPEVFTFSCAKCNNEFERVRKPGFILYCDNCRLIRQRERYRMKTVRRQGALASPRISCDEIAARDNFICHICVEPVDMTIPRTNRMGATLDHVVPLSKGGLDVRENLKLAHWICNNQKSNKMIGGFDA